MTPCQKLLKQEGTARRIESMQQSSATPSLHLWFLGVAEDCCMLSILLAVPSCFNSFWHGVIPTSYFIFNDFYTFIIIVGRCSSCLIYTSVKIIKNESVDSLCRDDADMPMPPYIRKACNCPNAAFVSLFR